MEITSECSAFQVLSLHVFTAITKPVKIFSDSVCNLVQFKLWSTVNDRVICRFTADAKDKPDGKCIRMCVRAYVHKFSDSLSHVIVP